MKMEAGPSSQAAASDIRALASGADRVQVALDALRGANLSTSQIADLKALASRYAAPSLESRRDALLKDYGIEVLGEGKVRLTLDGTSRIEFLREVKRVALELHGRPAVNAPCLEQWSGEQAFTEKISKGIAVDGNVADSTRMTRAEQRRKGWNNADLPDLAVAHAAYFLATGKDLFGGNIVRARGGALFFHASGLGVNDSDDDGRYDNVAACAALPARN